MSQIKWTAQIMNMSWTHVNNTADETLDPLVFEARYKTLRRWMHLTQMMRVE